MSHADPQPKRRALVTGITGQDGSYLAELLLAKGYEVHGVVRRSSVISRARLDPQLAHGIELAPYTLHYGDVTDAAFLMRIVLELAPDEVYHLAGQSHVRVSFDNPVYTAESVAMSALYLLEAARVLARRHPVRVYHASSSEMFGSADATPHTESTPFRPRSPYASAKVFAHNQVVNYREAYGLFACSGILFNHESPRRGESFVTRKITLGATRIREGLEDHLTLGNLAARRDWGYALDYVEAMWLMLQQPVPDDYIIATGQTHSIQDVLDQAFARVELDWRRYVRSDQRYLRPTEVDVVRGDPTKARRQLGWQPRTSFEQLIHLMVDADWELARKEAALRKH